MVLAHARALKTGDGAAVIHADLRDAGTILDHPDTRRLLDFSQPLAILFVAVLQFFGDRDAREALARFTGAAAPGPGARVVGRAGGPPVPARGGCAGSQAMRSGGVHG